MGLSDKVMEFTGHETLLMIHRIDEIAIAIDQGERSLLKA